MEAAAGSSQQHCTVAARGVEAALHGGCAWRGSSTAWRLRAAWWGGVIRRGTMS